MMSFIVILTAFMCSITIKADDPVIPKKRIIVCYRDEKPDWDDYCDKPNYQEKYCKFNQHKNCTHVIVRSAGKVDPMTAYYTGISKVGYYGHYEGEYKYIGPPSKMFQSVNPVTKDFSDGPQVVSSRLGRSRLIKTAIKSLQGAHYDGLDVVVEGEYIDDIIQLLMEMRPEFDKNNLLVSALFPATLTQRVDLSYVASNLDFISIKSFRDTKIGYVTMLMSPLYAEEGWSVDYSVNMYINMGVPREKIVVGIPTYAVTHQLEHPEFNFVGSNAWKKGRVIKKNNNGQEIFQDGFLSLDEVAANANEGILSRDKSSDAPYVSNYFLWISYEDKISVNGKVRYIRENDLGGAMLWPKEKYDSSGSPLPFADLLNETLHGGGN